MSDRSGAHADTTAWAAATASPRSLGVRPFEREGASHASPIKLQVREGTGESRTPATPSTPKPRRPLQQDLGHTPDRQFPGSAEGQDRPSPKREGPRPGDQVRALQGVRLRARGGAGRSRSKGSWSALLLFEHAVTTTSDDSRPRSSLFAAGRALRRWSGRRVRYPSGIAG